METCDERRRRKLKLLAERVDGGLEAIAEAVGLKGPDNLQQILNSVLLPPRKSDGVRAPKGLGDPTARLIEEKYKLGRGWFDNDWPFETVSQELYDQLTERQKGMVEAELRAAIDRLAPSKGKRKAA